MIDELLAPSGVTPDPTLGLGGGAIYAAGFHVLNITAFTLTDNATLRLSVTAFC